MQLCTCNHPMTTIVVSWNISKIGWWIILLNHIDMTTEGYNNMMQFYVSLTEKVYLKTEMHSFKLLSIKTQIWGHSPMVGCQNKYFLVAIMQQQHRKLSFFIKNSWKTSMKWCQNLTAHAQSKEIIKTWLVNGKFTTTVLSLKDKFMGLNCHIRFCSRSHRLC